MKQDLEKYDWRKELNESVLKQVRRPSGWIFSELEKDIETLIQKAISTAVKEREDDIVKWAEEEKNKNNLFHDDKPYRRAMSFLISYIRNK